MLEWRKNVFSCCRKVISDVAARWQGRICCSISLLSQRRAGSLCSGVVYSEAAAASRMRKCASRGDELSSSTCDVLRRIGKCRVDYVQRRCCQTCAGWHLDHLDRQLLDPFRVLLVDGFFLLYILWLQNALRTLGDWRHHRIAYHAHGIRRKINQSKERKRKLMTVKIWDSVNVVRWKAVVFDGKICEADELKACNVEGWRVDDERWNKTMNWREQNHGQIDARLMKRIMKLMPSTEWCISLWTIDEFWWETCSLLTATRHGAGSQVQRGVEQMHKVDFVHKRQELAFNASSICKWLERLELDLFLQQLQWTAKHVCLVDCDSNY